MTNNKEAIDALLRLFEDRPHRPTWHAAIRALVAERDALKRENEAQTYKGNSVWYWHSKAEAYGGCINSLWIMLSAAGYQPDGEKPIVDALTALVAEHNDLRRIYTHLSTSWDALSAENAALKKRVEELQPQPSSDFRERDEAMVRWMNQVTGILYHQVLTNDDVKEDLGKRYNEAIAAMRKGDTNGK